MLRICDHSFIIGDGHHSAEGGDMTQRLVGRARLAELVKLTAATIVAWERAGLLEPIETAGGVRYDVDALDALFAASNFNFTSRTPRFSDVLAGDLVLLDVVEVAARLQVSAHWASLLVARGSLEAIQIRRQFLVDAVSVAARIEARNDQLYLPVAVVEHVLGVSKWTVAQLQAEGRLERGPGNYRATITRESLVQLLSELLPDTIEPLDWLDDRLVSTWPLKYVSELATTQTDRPRVQALVDAGELQYIRMPYADDESTSKKLKISSSSYVAYMQRNLKRLTPEEIAQAFGVASIQNWRRLYPGCLACPVHDHDDAALYYDCLVGVLGRYLTKGASPRKWLHARFETNTPVLDVEEAAVILAVTPEEALELVGKGLHGLCTPGGTWKFSRHAVVRLRDVRSAQAKLARGE